jgi:hypothetical protein
MSLANGLKVRQEVYDASAVRCKRHPAHLRFKNYIKLHRAALFALGLNRGIPDAPFVDTALLLPIVGIQKETFRDDTKKSY